MCSKLRLGRLATSKNRCVGSLRVPFPEGVTLSQLGALGFPWAGRSTALQPTEKYKRYP